jgi:hypothetical protein
MNNDHKLLKYYSKLQKLPENSIKKNYYMKKIQYYMKGGSVSYNTDPLYYQLPSEPAPQNLSRSQDLSRSTTNIPTSVYNKLPQIQNTLPTSIYNKLSQEKRSPSSFHVSNKSPLVVARPTIREDPSYILVEKSGPFKQGLTHSYENVPMSSQKSSGTYPVQDPSSSQRMSTLVPSQRKTPEYRNVLESDLQSSPTTRSIYQSQYTSNVLPRSVSQHSRQSSVTYAVPETQDTIFSPSYAPNLQQYSRSSYNTPPNYPPRRSTSVKSRPSRQLVIPGFDARMKPCINTNDNIGAWCKKNFTTGQFTVSKIYNIIDNLMEIIINIPDLNKRHTIIQLLKDHFKKIGMVENNSIKQLGDFNYFIHKGSISIDIDFSEFLSNINKDQNLKQLGIHEIITHIINYGVPVSLYNTPETLDETQKQNHYLTIPLTYLINELNRIH